jgi:hydroxyacylglutathione hydrolase
MRVEIVPCLRDNYAYLLVDDVAGFCVVVDASEAAPVRAALARVDLPLLAILSTHHHPDHVGGNDALVQRYAGLTVYGHHSDRRRVPALNHPLDDGDVFTLGTMKVHAHHVPGHTLGALAYEVTPAEGARWVFTGDTLFLAGCGRLFEGTPAQMFASLQKIAALGDDVLVACGHEYTAANLRFAQHLDPNDPAIAGRIAEVAALRERGEPTVPASMAVEKATNPFLRAPDLATFTARREAKDRFAG